jgi:putative GTP pyrophosphokinase
MDSVTDNIVSIEEVVHEDISEIKEERFDFENHRTKAIEEYRKNRLTYQRFADTVNHILEAALKANDVTYHKIEARAKEFDSFGKKSAKQSETNPNKPKYLLPLEQITDLAGVRIITFFPKTLMDVDKCINSEFLIVEKTDKSEELEEEGKFGYKSIHYLVRMKPQRLVLPEYSTFNGLTAEIQSRTILQHAWAEMEHDIQYKSVDVIPKSIRRRFVALSGMLEIADREFQTIQDEDEKIRAQARINVEEGRLDEIEITPDALKSYLDKRLSPDGRMSLFSYEFLARLLRRLGFINFRQIDECVADYDDDNISRMVWGSRLGQVSRFEDMLLAGMGENFLKLHFWSNEEWWIESTHKRLKKMKDSGVKIKNFIPGEI